jgi:hypothetical protein
MIRHPNRDHSQPSAIIVEDHEPDPADALEYFWRVVELPASSMW